ncbi:hypothetical protein HK097_008247 [Rhizophlyctis rosea]|uniref:Uncharacterized protein n=1 Tax=Rhizophlyctis rosea TaxID=64517 RepID=A0AAD5SAH4_9FUNG|nr:hypothetical protein HK097_008247 [Rhizophlyctis rosea]
MADFLTHYAFIPPKHQILLSSNWEDVGFLSYTSENDVRDKLTAQGFELPTATHYVKILKRDYAIWNGQYFGIRESFKFPEEFAAQSVAMRELLDEVYAAVMATLSDPNDHQKLFKVIPRLLHMFGLLPSDHPLHSVAFTMTAARKEFFKPWYTTVNNLINDELGSKHLELMMSPSGTGKSTALLALIKALACIFQPDKLVPLYYSFPADSADSTTLRILPSQAILLALSHAGHTDFMMQVPHGDPTKLGNVLTYLPGKKIRCVVVLDEIQNIAKGSAEFAQSASAQLAELQRVTKTVWAIMSSSSLYSYGLLRGSLSEREAELGQLVNFKSVVALQNDKMILRSYYPIHSRKEFERVLGDMINPHLVSYDSTMWSLYTVALQEEPGRAEEEGSIYPMEVEGETAPTTFVIPLACIQSLYAGCGGRLRELNALLGAMKDQAVGASKTELGLPDEKRWHERMTALISELNIAFDTYPKLEQLYGELLDVYSGRMEGEGMEMDLFDLGLVSLADIKLKSIDQALLCLFADAGQLRMEYRSVAGTMIGFPTPNAIIALLVHVGLQARVENTGLTPKDLWVARLVLFSCGIEMETIMNRALVNKAMVKSGAAVFCVDRYDGDHFATELAEVRPPLRLAYSSQ